MKRKNAMSAIGYAIVTIIIVALGMIISAPMITDKYQGDEKTEPVVEKKYSNNDIQALEDRLNARIDSIKKSENDKYICSIEGGLNEDGIVVPINPNNPPAKFVFTCEYKK